jgi:hypothetical protein
LDLLRKSSECSEEDSSILLVLHLLLHLQRPRMENVPDAQQMLRVGGAEAGEVSIAERHRVVGHENLRLNVSQPVNKN